MTVRRTSVFPAGREAVFEKLRHLETLQFIAAPYAAFEPAGEAVSVWTAGSRCSFRFRLFCFIPFGVHTIHIVQMDQDGIRSREGNRHVPVWNHWIRLRPLDREHTEYTDEVEIRAGWKTVFVWLWARAFYAHRQRKWIRMLKAEKKNSRQ